MKNSKKILLFSICIIIVIIIVIIVILTSKTNNDEVKKEEDTNTVQEVEQYTDTIQDISTHNEYFMVRSSLYQYLDEMNNNNDKYYGIDENNERKKLFTQEDINKVRLNLLSKKYISENNINTNNLNNHIETFEEKVLFNVLNIKVKRNLRVDTYIVYGQITKLNNEPIGERYFIVNIDKENKTFSIEALNNNFESIDDVTINNELTSIEKNDNNQYKQVNITEEQIAKEYFNNNKRFMLYAQQLAYDSLDIEYREKRFGSMEDFNEFIQKNKQDYLKLELSKYLVNKYDNYTEYVCMDQYENLYIFKEEKPMKYSLKLDTYTIESDKFKEEYDKGNYQVKTQLNINKFILMINNQDYKNAYNLLEDGFKQNYFQTQEQFEAYAKQSLYRYNKIKFKSFDIKGNVYICDIELTDLTEGRYIDDSKGTGGSGYVIEKKIFVQLEDAYNFILSFEMQN